MVKLINEEVSPSNFFDTPFHWLADSPFKAALLLGSYQKTWSGLPAPRIAI